MSEEKALVFATGAALLLLGFGVLLATGSARAVSLAPGDVLVVAGTTTNTVFVANLPNGDSVVSQGGSFHGLQDLALVAREAIEIIFGGPRPDEDATLSELVNAGRAARIVSPFLDTRLQRHLGAGGDHDGDGIDDLLFALPHNAIDGLSRVFYIPGRRRWPSEVFVDDSVSLASLVPADRLGAADA